MLYVNFSASRKEIVSLWKKNKMGEISIFECSLNKHYWSVSCTSLSHLQNYYFYLSGKKTETPDHSYVFPG